MSFYLSLNEFIGKDEGLSQQAQLVRNFLNQVNTSGLSEVDKGFLLECTEKYRIIAADTSPWKGIWDGTLTDKSTQDQIAAIFLKMNTALANKEQNTSFITRAITCTWIAQHHTKIQNLLKNLPQAEAKYNIANDIIRPIQQIVYFRSFAENWKKMYEKSTETSLDFKKTLQSLYNKFSRLISAMNQIVKADELEQKNQSKNKVVNTEVISAAVKSSMYASKIEQQPMELVQNMLKSTEELITNELPKLDDAFLIYDNDAPDTTILTDNPQEPEKNKISCDTESLVPINNTKDIALIVIFIIGLGIIGAVGAVVGAAIAFGPGIGIGMFIIGGVIGAAVGVGISSLLTIGYMGIKRLFSNPEPEDKTADNSADLTDSKDNSNESKPIITGQLSFFNRPDKSKPLQTESTQESRSQEAQVEQQPTCTIF